MRYIDLSKLQLPTGWQEKADSLNAKLKTATSDTEKAKIMDENPIWRELFIPLSQLSHGKCWYSEALDTMSDRDVDHFRPKNEAQNVDNIPRGDVEGYWWLAYDWTNYRFSSQYSNQRRKDKFDKKRNTGGKGEFFPLFKGSFIAKSKNKFQDEQIMLLDPCEKDDPGLLTFDSKGVAIPDASAILDPDDRIRVEVSIRLYHLDHKPLEELRERIWWKCQRQIDEIRKITSDPEGMSNFAKSRVKFIKDEIRRMMEHQQELSAVAIACCEQNGLKVLTQNI
jgi:uncharacterized protein (TIGR02646 family)